MENTLNLLLQDKDTEWFTTSENRVVGPLSNQEVLMRIQSGALNFGSFLWKAGQKDWQRVIEIPDFSPLLPTAPSVELLKQAQNKASASQPVTSPPPMKPPEMRYWYVYIDEAQYGPFSDNELKSLIGAGRVAANTYVWKKGYPDWKTANDTEEWQALFQQKPKKLSAEERRRMPRKPLEAKLLLTDGNEVGWAVCRDISIGGMQVLMDNANIEQGAMLKINVTAGDEIPNFACEAEIVRILEDGRGFSVRFSSIPESAVEAINSYIKS